MRIDANDAITLKAVIDADLAALRRIDAALAELDQVPLLGERDWIAAAYYLHGAYCALENTFEQISRTFENHVKDVSRWHQELLRKMFLDLTPLRPAVLPADLQGDLNDLRGFRHVFRHGYGIDLDVERLQSLVRRWRHMSPHVQRALSLFAEELSRAALL